MFLARAFAPTLVLACSIACSRTPETAPVGADPAPAGAADSLSLARLFSDHAVLQRELPLRVWGRATPGAEVRVTLGESESRGRADETGSWSVELSGLRAGGPFELVASAGGARAVARDVLVGEVWLGAGQSNMGTRMKQVENAPREKAGSACPRLRVFMVTKEFGRTVPADVEGEWLVLSPETVESVSAVAYFFGRELEAALDAPVGVVVSAVGGTGIEAWTPRPAQDAVPGLAEMLRRVEAYYAEKTELYLSTGTPEFYRRQHELALAQWEAAGGDHEKLGRRPKLIRHPLESKNYPGNLYNAMIAPFARASFRGVIWYQGEYNTGTSLETREAVDPSLYALQFETLVQSWREAFDRELPFYAVQLTGWLAPTNAPVQDHGWPEIREQQWLGARMRGTGLAVTLDLGDARNIHPPRKRQVGERLARLARHRVYGEQGVVDQGPVLDSTRRTGNELVLEFAHADGLRTRDGRPPRAFALAGADRVWHAAIARLEGTRVILSSPEVSAPVAARHAWSANPQVNLVNGADLPAFPFRTDDWPIVREEANLPDHFQGEDD